MDFRGVPFGSDLGMRKTRELKQLLASCCKAEQAARLRSPLRSTGYFIKRRLFRPGFEALVHGLRFLGCDCDLLRLLAKFFLHEGQGVIPWRQTLNLVLSALISDGEERTLHHVDVHLHPRMLVA